MKDRLNNFILILFFLVGLSLLLYPSFSDYWNSFTQSKAIAVYTEQLANLNDELYDKMLEEAKVKIAAEAHAEGLAEGLAKGVAEGLAEGTKKNQIETAKKMLNMGMSIDLIAEISGLPKEEIKDL